MKNIFKYIIVLAASMSFLTSCEDWKLLDENPKKIGSTTFLDDAKSVKAEINSIYYHMRRTEVWGRYLSVLTESLSDYCYGRGNFATTYENGLTSGGQGFTKDTWAVIYRSIRLANNLLVDMKDVPMTDKERAEFTAEIRYLRAFSYLQLVKYWGGVPLFDETNMNDFNKPRSSAEDIWAFILKDAQYAAENLPATVAESGRPTKYSALMVVTEASMWTQDYTTAANACATIINDGKYSLVELATAADFANVYAHTTVNSSEEIFYIKYNRESGNTFEWMYLCKPNPVYATGALGIYTDYEKNTVIKNWDNNDFRYQWTLYHSTNATLGKLTKTGYICIKFRDTETNGSTMATDFPVYRYADCLLYNAEAIARRDGKPNATAMEMINMVRRRAYGLNPKVAHESDYALADYSTLDKFIELLLKEKAYEQCFEGKRYADLKRMGLLAKYAVKAGRVASESAVGEAAYWWPIPTSEFNYNTALDPTVDQNPGY